jgi:hypothetical protein
LSFLKLNWLAKFRGDRLSWLVQLQSPNSAEKKQDDRILFSYGGDRLCKCSTTGGAGTI